MRQHQSADYNYPDLPKASDDILSIELDFTIRQYMRIKNDIDTHVRQTSLFPTMQPQNPMWMLKSDLDFCLDRYDAIIEEIRYRKENMI